MFDLLWEKVSDCIILRSQAGLFIKLNIMFSDNTGDHIQCLSNQKLQTPEFSP